ncbi:MULTISPECIES: hypothetical protein [unclassified Dehalobacter]|jgi:hypothetical protein|nr:MULTISPECIES: hypothetical protein [unclassified Dehalobacter]
MAESACITGILGVLRFALCLSLGSLPGDFLRFLETLLEAIA